jgi:hypothetical protein
VRWLVGLLSLVAALPCAAQRWIWDDRAFDAVVRGESVTTVYAHSDYDGSNGAADGSLAKPFTTLAACEAVAGAGDTRVWGGTFRESVTIADDNPVIRAWTFDEIQSVPGASERYWTIRGDQIATGWSADGTYTNTLVASTNAPVSKPRGVVIDWDSREWADGRHNAHLEEAASAALCDATAGTWFWATDRLIVNPPAGVVLNDHVVGWCQTGSGLIVEGDGGTAEFGNLYLWTDTDAGNGYGFKGSAVDDWTVTGLVAIDCGYHHIGYAVGKCDNNWMVGCTAIGGNYTCDSYFIVYSSSGDLDNSGGIGCAARLSPLLKYTAVEGSEAYTDYIKGPSAVAPDQTAFGSHTGSSQVIANGGVLWQDCTVSLLCVTNVAYKRQAFSNGQDGTEPADKDDAATYSIRFVDCSLPCDWMSLGQGTSSSVFTSSMAFQRCYIDGRTCVDSSIGAGATPNVIYANRVWVLLESCTLVGETPAGNGLVRIRGTSTDLDILRIKNCSFYAFGSTGSFIHRMDGSNETIAVHSVFASENAITLFGSNTTVTATSYQFSKCWYGDTISAFGRGAAYDTQAEWTAAVDPNGRYGVDFDGEFSDTVTLRPSLAGTLIRTLDLTANPLAPAGINGGAYRGVAGAWQLAGVSPRGRSRPRVRRRGA